MTAISALYWRVVSGIIFSTLTGSAAKKRASEIQTFQQKEILMNRNIIKMASVLIAISVCSLRAIEPVDPNMIPEARAVLDYFESIYKKKTVTGIKGHDARAGIVGCIYKDPVILATDMTGWNSPKYGESYCNVIATYLHELIAHHERGGLVTVHFHWPNPLSGTVGFKSSKEDLTDEQWEKIITPGTAEYKTMLEDLDWHIDKLLQPLADRRIPVLWRPLHEINGGWFWWTCKDEAKTAELWRIIFNHMVKVRKLHNLIWVFNEAKMTDRSDIRVPFHPGLEYYDIASIDLYGMDARDKGTITTHHGPASFGSIFRMMEEIHPGKMIGLGEVQEIPNMEKTAAGDPNFAPWLFAVPWWYEDNGDANCKTKPCNPCWWVKEAYLHEFAITLDEFSLEEPPPQQVDAKFSVTPTTGYAPLEVQLDASGSAGANLTYSWSFGEGEDGSGQKTTYTYNNPGTYRIVLTVSDGSASDKDSVELVVSDPSVTPEQLTIDDSQVGTDVNQFNFSSGWNTASSDGAYMSTEHYSSQQGAYFTVSFYGSQFSLYSTTDTHHGIASVTINNEITEEVDLYSAGRAEQQLIYTSPVLEKGSHQVKVEVSGLKNSLSEGSVVVADRMDIFLNAQTTALNPSKRFPIPRNGTESVYDIYTLNGKLVGTVASPEAFKKFKGISRSAYIVRERSKFGKSTHSKSHLNYFLPKQ